MLRYDERRGTWCTNHLLYFIVLFFPFNSFFFHPSRNRCASCTVWSWQCFPWNLYFHLRSVAKSSFSHRVKYLDATPFISHIFLEKRKNEDYGVMKKPFNKQQKPTKKRKSKTNTTKKPTSPFFSCWRVEGRILFTDMSRVWMWPSW